MVEGAGDYVIVTDPVVEREKNFESLGLYVTNNEREEFFTSWQFKVFLAIASLVLVGVIMYVLTLPTPPIP